VQPLTGHVIPNLLRSAEPSRPVLTFYDDATGERAELSGTTAENWVAKTANLLVDGCGLGGGDRAGVWLPPHWQTAVVLFGCWSAGLTVSGPALSGPAVSGAAPSGAAPSGAAPSGAAPADASTGEVDVVFAATDRLDAPGAAATAPDRYALGLAPMAMPLRSVPDGWTDYVVAVRAHGDAFSPTARPLDPATPRASQQELCARARARADALGLVAGDRVLVDAGAHPDPLDWLLAPLAAGASIVLCRHLDRGRLPGRRAAEMVTRELGSAAAPG
jgi:uncharacterized protein (TIGR03089 family)